MLESAVRMHLGNVGLTSRPIGLAIFVNLYNYGPLLHSSTEIFANYNVRLVDFHHPQFCFNLVVCSNGLDYR
jgi:hypothetical protein